MDAFDVVVGGLCGAFIVGVLFFAFGTGYDKGVRSTCEDLRLRVGVEAYDTAVKAEICVKR